MKATSAIASRSGGRLRIAAFALATALVGTLAASSAAGASPGAFDPTFGTAGLAINQFALGLTPTSLGADVAAAPGGDIVVAGGIEEKAGESKVLVARYLPNGTLDTSFGTGGAITFQAGEGAKASSVALYSALQVLPDGRIVLAGRASGGKEAGEEQGFVARLLPTGALDVTFGGGIIRKQLSKDKTPAPYTEFLGLTVEESGSIVLAGTSTDEEAHDEFVAMRIGSNGVPDASFGTAGLYRHQLGSGSGSAVPSSLGSSVIRQPNGELVFSGSASESSTASGMLAVRLTSAGKPDLGFGSGGATILQPTSTPGTITAAVRVAEQPGGKLVLGGVAAFDAKDDAAFAVARLNADGTPDPSFGSGGATLTQLSPATAPVSEGVGLVVQGNGRIVLPGLVELESSHYIFTVARYTAEGALDPTFGSHGVVQQQLSTPTEPSSASLGAAIDPQGRLLVAGAYGLEGHLASMVARLELDAPPTVSFGGGPGCLAGATNETFTASASDPEEAVTAIDWDLSGNGQFADAHGATVTVPASAITAPGGKISVRATDADGITAVATHAPEVPPCAPLASSFGGVALVGSRLTMDAHGNVTLHVSSAVPASGQITLTSGPVKVTSGHGKHRRTIRKRVQLAKVSFKLASSGQTTLRVKLTTAGQALVRKLRKLGITVTIRGLGAGRSVTTIAKATIAAPKAKRKRKR